jgi:phosphate butyryltransferase
LFKNFTEMVEGLKHISPTRLAVVQAADVNVLRSVKIAQSKGIITPILIGDRAKIESEAEKADFTLSNLEIISCDNKDAASIGVELISEKKADVLMKGMISTAPFIKAVLNPEYSLVKGKLISHLGAFHIPSYNKILFITDAGINISPSLEEKCIILQNAINTLLTLGYKKPKVAILTAVETVSIKMSACVDAAILSKMADRGQITGAFVDGPLALDNAINREAADQKGINSLVAGDADILLVPNIETGNTLAKSITFLAGGNMAGVVIGAKAPIVLTSRADSSETKFMSIALACKIASGER